MTPDPFNGLTDTQARDAAWFAGGDDRVSRLTTGRDYQIFSYAPWTVGETQVGAFLVLEFAKPFAVDGDFPYADDSAQTDGGASPTYVERTAHYDFDTKTVGVLVDLKSLRVVEITPYEYSVHEDD